MIIRDIVTRGCENFSLIHVYIYKELPRNISHIAQ